MSSSTEAGGRFLVLFVCTGNICRSAMAEGFARRELERRPGLPVAFASAGSHAMGGAPATMGAIEAAAERGAELTRHRARELVKGLVRSASLVLYMSAEHRRFVLGCDRTAAARAFPLAAFVRALEGMHASSPAGLVAAAGERVVVGSDDDVDDPLGQSRDEYRACAERLDGLVTRLVQALAEASGAAVHRQPA
jgi:protein-tyrosine-phosphatase